MLKGISGFITAMLLFYGYTFAQSDIIGQKGSEKIPNNWYQLDAESSGFNGINLEKAYAFLKSKKLKSHRIIVAVIDTGIDTMHEDLKPILWTNPAEIPGNGIDDDHNGYIDDIHGWNFLGGKDGRNVKEDSYESARVYYSLKPVWERNTKNADELSPEEKAAYNSYLKAKSSLFDEIDFEEVVTLRSTLPKMRFGDSIIRSDLGKNEYNANDIKGYSSKNLYARITRSFILEISKDNNNYEISNKEILDELNGKVRKADAAIIAPANNRKDIVQDDESDIKDRYYGNNDIMTGTPFHGTHCSGIIAAVRNNFKGIDGIADDVRIMMVRALPDGDEHDKDVANAIRYATENGAKIISLSFGKSFSPQKQWVDDAFRFAESKGVLIVQAAGNDAKNIDSLDNFPNPVYIDGKGRAGNLITVGASGNTKKGGLIANFSNYGKTTVDVFAPGVGIYSSVPGMNTYGSASGTSMSCPVVAGIAALLLEHYPGLTTQQLKYIIERSALPPSEKVTLPGTDQLVYLKDICKTGGIVNAYEAVKLAGSLQAEKIKTLLPKPKMKKTKLG